MKRFLLLFICKIVLAQDAMILRSVQVIGAINEGAEAKPASVGGGFIADAHHVVTTMSCCNQTKDGKQKFPVIRFGEEFGAGKLVWTGPGQLAILEVQKGLKAPALTLVPSKLIQKGQPIYSVAIPAKGSPTVSESAVQDIAKSEQVELPVIRSKASGDSVDSGGALFDACGNVLGINLFVDSGTQFAFIVDPIAEGLQKVGVQASVADKACAGSANDKKETGKKEAPGTSSWRMPQGGEWVGVAIIVGLLALALRRGGSKPARVATTTMPDPPLYVPPAVPKIANPVLRGVTGQYAGTSIPLDAAATLGRDSHFANLVFTSDADAVSKRHCSIRWDAARSIFVLQDLGSTNGTFLASGERLASNQPRDLKAGQRFYLGDQKNQFEVVLE